MSGRIDRKIEFPNPNEKAREDILKIHVGTYMSFL
jgi:26S proteasome regulatory subunit T6